MANGFRDMRSPENRKWTEWPKTELEHLTVKSTLYTFNTYPCGPNFGPFRSTISRFRDTTCIRSPKIGNAPNEPELNLNTWQSKGLYICIPVYTKYLLLMSKVLIRFALRLAVSEIKHVQGRRKTETHRMTPNQTWTLNSHPIYTKYLPLRPKFWSISLYD